MKKLYVVTDLGPGDGGKGGVVHKIAHMRNAHTIVKVGGAQGSHGVRTSSGKSFAFSQFGCGTLEGVRTHISKRFVVDPVALVTWEATGLADAGVSDPLSLLTVSEDALCSTIFHTAASQLNELRKRDNPRGTIGSGVGQAYRLNESHPDMSIYVRDLQSPTLRDKLSAIQEHYRNLYKEALSNPYQLISQSGDMDIAMKWFGVLVANDMVDAVYETLQEAAKAIRIVPDWYMATSILSQDGVVVSESSHGVLTDSHVGFHPHTSALRTLPRFARTMYEEAGYDGEIVSLGVHRAYNIRHGAGPLPTHSEPMGELLLPGSNKLENRWQGKVRVGPLDLVLLRYAIAASGPDAYDGLAITWFDQVAQNGEWQMCNQYDCSRSPLDHFFTPQGDLTVWDKKGDNQRRYLQELTKLLQVITPEIKSVPLPSGADRDQLYELVAKKLLDHLGVPVRMISFGPTEQDKICK
jgi:adenylosuccinate synthase